MKTAFLLVFAAWIIGLVITIIIVIGRVIHRSEPDPEDEREEISNLLTEKHRSDREQIPYSKRLHDFNDSCDFEPTPKIENGSRVSVLLAGDPFSYHNGTVINARKQWVELDKDSFLHPFIADESNISQISLIDNFEPKDI